MQHQNGEVEPNMPPFGGVPAFALHSQALADGRVCVAVEGELDLASADRLRVALAQELSIGHEVLLDLGGVGFIDSTGLAAIVGAISHAPEVDAKLEFSADLQPQPRRLMELTGVLPMLSPVDGGPRPG